MLAVKRLRLGTADIVPTGWPVAQRIIVVSEGAV